MKRLICWFFGHRWRGFLGGTECARCACYIPRRYQRADT